MSASKISCAPLLMGVRSSPVAEMGPRAGGTGPLATGLGNPVPPQGEAYTRLGPRSKGEAMTAELTQEARNALVREAPSQFGHLAGDYVIAMNHERGTEEVRSRLLACAEIVGNGARRWRQLHVPLLGGRA
jgi:hypothetical protein